MGSNKEVPACKETVLVTGFGPFGVHKINASMETVKLLPSLDLERELGIQLVTKEIPVEYSYVKTQIPQLWELYKPKLVVHVGVSGMAQELTLETQAFNKGYGSLDIQGCVPEGGVCVEGCPDRLESAIDMRKICQNVNDSSCDVVSCISTDPGRYLCDFVFYSSLHVDRTRVAFVHVPVLDKPYSALQLAQGLKLAIAGMLAQVREKDSNFKKAEI
ncbi:pyroglutamyl-peptidase 1 [Daphnia magna]|uniref:pyroglutamyl-peptidase 1 n=1 Tax=Daphnia magna TaxID=35525 RepID=UPI001E1BD151|nr:pyroglutamyl-peptidase 1 [Daphnia magna]